jgi:16S rRNA processing protein RimM
LAVAADWEDMALVGRIARPHGIRGQLIVNPDTDFPQDRFTPGAELFVRRGETVEVVTITTVRFQHERPVIGLRGVDDIDAATAYAGAELRVPPSQLTPLPEGVFYQHQLIGCSVVTVSGDPVGTVRAVEGSMGATRLVVTGVGGDEVLIPLAVDICVAIDPSEQRIVVAPPEGLLTLNAASPQGSRAERRSAARSRRAGRGGQEPQPS